ncbi:hypothetical protein F5Y16DRAFT_362482 [Xylariaceae sp. FL0255]|nr:hypothetical protein F5Y16DRAFT_362482 [Xylariaceae sp. FL0255]
MASRYSGTRYDGDSRRSRSRDRSPDRRSLYSDGGPRRSSAESRTNTNAFQANRDSFRDTLPRDTPRGPKALLDPSLGHRGGGYSGEFRGGRGRGRGRGWRDDSRDRGRERDIDFRDRRDANYRDERSRERDRPDWRERDRDNFRGRRASPRGRSPPGRDFRDTRDPRDGPLGVDAERARRGSRDGPLSAGSSSSDPPFAHSSYRGGYGRGRGRGRGGDWDRGRGRPPFYDDRDRYGGPFRSRSQEGRFRDRDDRERDNRYMDTDVRPRDIRDDRDARDRETRPKPERTSHEPPSITKDVSPPPVAPPAPSFGSVPNRTALTTDLSSTIGKAPPTGPRALRDDRPTLLGIPPVTDERGPPVGPSKPLFIERSPPMPAGLRSQRPGPSSRQWINPALKNRAPESPKLGRSQSFAQQARPAGFRPDGAPADHHVESGQRPRSSDAKADLQAAKNEIPSRDLHSSLMGDDSKIDIRPRSSDSRHSRDYKFKEEPISAHHDSDDEEEPGEIVTPSKSGPDHYENAKARHDERLNLKRFEADLSIPPSQDKHVVLDQSSESDDEEFGDVIESEMAGVEKELKQLEAIEDTAPVDAIVRYAFITLEALTQIATVSEGLGEMVGRIPEKALVPTKIPSKVDSQAVDHPATNGLPVCESHEPAQETKSSPQSTSKILLGHSEVASEQPKPSIELDGDDLRVQEATAKEVPREPKQGNEDEDVVMEDAVGSHGDSEAQPTASTLPIPTIHGDRLLPSFDEARIDSHNPSKGPSTTPSPQEDEDETDIEDVDLQTIEIVREHLQTPPLDSLPFFDEKPWDQDKAFLKSMDTPQSGLNAFILQTLATDKWNQLAVDNKLKREYGDNYDRYIRFTMSDDPIAVKSREKFTYVPGASDPVGQKPGFTAEPKPESTRRSRYASERDLERVLEESRRVEDEKRERQQQAEREKYRTDKEAVIPCQYLNDAERENDFFEDSTGLVGPEKIVATWEVLPPVDNFTEEEYEIFEKAYLEFPKQWGRVSEPLPTRDFGTSIQFYYLKKEKEELNLKEKLKKQPKKRKKGGRSKARSSALVSDLGNGGNDNEESQDLGDGERRRPRRAAAPTFNSEATPATDGEGGTPAGTPGRRNAAAPRDPDKRRGRKPKAQDSKQQRGNVALAPTPNHQQTPSTTARGNRSRSTSRVQSSDWMVQQMQEDGSRLQSQYDLSTNPGIPSAMMMQQFQQPPSLLSPERGGPHADAMAPPPLRPEPPQPPVTVLDMSQPTPSDRKPGGQPSSYWSVPEASEFPSLLRSFGSDWGAIASHMRTKTAVMVKNYYTRRKDGNDWEAIVREAEDRKYRGEKRPPPPQLTTSVKKRYDTGTSNRPLAAADAIMEDAPQTKLEQLPTSQSMTGRFNVPIAANPQPPVGPSPFVQTTQPPVIALVPQPGSQAPTQTMSPVPQPLRAPLPFSSGEREPFMQQRTPLVSKPHVGPPSEPTRRQPLPGSLIDPHVDLQKAEQKPPKDPLRQQERQQLRVKQEPEPHPHEFYGSGPPSIRGPPSRLENVSLSSRPPETSRAPAHPPPAPYAALHSQPGRGFLSETTPSSPVPPRPLSNLSRPLSGTSGGDPYHAPPAQHTPPSTTPAPLRAPKTSNLMALLNDDPPAPPPKRANESPAIKTSSTPPPQSSLSRPPPPPPPPPPAHVRRESSIPEAQAYGYGRTPQSAGPSSMPSLKPFTASPQSQPLNAPRHLAMEGASDRDYYRSRAFPPVTAGSPQNTPLYQPPPTQAQYQPQSSYPYGAAVQPQGSNAASPPPQYISHQPASRHHDASASSRDVGWSGATQRHPLQQHPHPHQQAQQQPAAWQSHAPQPPKSAQPQPAPSAWGEQHGASKTPQPAGSLPPQSAWPGTQQPRGHDPMVMRDPYPPSRMQPPLSQGSYPPSSRAPEPPPPQAPGGYPRYTNTPVSGRDLRDQGPPPRSYTPVSAYDGRAFPPQGADVRDTHLREQQQQPSVLHQQLRPQDNRPMYDRPPLDRYGR